MNSRFLALLALSFLITGCTQLTILSTDTTDAGQPPASSAVPEPEPPVETPAPVDLSVTVTQETGPDIASVLIDPDAVVPELPLSDTPTDVSEPPVQPESVVEETDQETAGLLVQTPDQERSVRALCREIGNKLGSVSVEDCLAQPLVFAGAYTVQGRPIVVRDFYPDERTDKKAPRILIMGGIHGDEYSSISIMFKWMEKLAESGNSNFQWRFAPSVNPDGLLDGQAIRQNANGVDLNRNFPSEDWMTLAEEYWANTTSKNPRRYPGTHPASEPEVRWIVDQIKSFKPDVIVSVHAPYHLLDYDGPPEPPQRIGELHLHLLGVYPGSLGNYAGLNLGIPVVTMELPSAGIMPNSEQISSMWNDLLKWLNEHHES